MLARMRAVTGRPRAGPAPVAHRWSASVPKVPPSSARCARFRLSRSSRRSSAQAGDRTTVMPIFLAIVRKITEPTAGLEPAICCLRTGGGVVGRSRCLATSLAPFCGLVNGWSRRGTRLCTACTVPRLLATPPAQPERAQVSQHQARPSCLTGRCRHGSWPNGSARRWITSMPLLTRLGDRQCCALATIDAALLAH